MGQSYQYGLGRGLQAQFAQGIATTPLVHLRPDLSRLRRVGLRRALESSILSIYLPALRAGPGAWKARNSLSSEGVSVQFL